MVYTFWLINKHLQYRCLEFTILKRTWRIFAKKIINFSLEFRIKTCKILVHHTVSFHWLNIIYWVKHFISWDKTTNLSPWSTFWISNQWQIPENYNIQRTTRARELEKFNLLLLEVHVPYFQQVCEIFLVINIHFECPKRRIETRYRRGDATLYGLVETSHFTCAESNCQVKCL